MAGVTANMSAITDQHGDGFANYIPRVASYIPYVEKATPTTVALGSTLLLILLYIYWLALPKPVPGIPYNKDSRWRVLGDIPRFRAHMKTNKEINLFAANECVGLNSPIIQVFLIPFSKKPLIIISDHREAEDIMARRTKEFDRPSANKPLFEGLVPRSTIAMVSDDHFKMQRKMWAGIMSNSFLNDVATPKINDAGVELIRVWQLKVKLAAGRPFDPVDDLHQTALDAIWHMCLGTELGGIRSQIEHLEKPGAAITPGSIDTPADVPKAPLPRVYAAMQKLMHTNDEANTSSAPTLYGKYLRMKPSYKQALKVKSETMASLLKDAREKFAEKDAANNSQINSAMDFVMRKEAAMTKDTISTREHDLNMIDELFMFLIAGYETTATSLAWCMKYLADNPISQARLRTHLRNTFPSDLPTASQILAANLPYADAFCSEVLRVSRTGPLALREATCDFELFGHRLPKGTYVGMCLSGETYLHAPLPMPESRRSPSSRASGAKYTDWKDKDVQGRRAFTPDRWLEPDTDGKEIFNANAGPSMPFSAGPRGCFGKKMGWMELKVMVCLIVMGFESLPVPDELNSYEALTEAITRAPKSVHVRLRAL